MKVRSITVVSTAAAVCIFVPVAVGLSAEIDQRMFQAPFLEQPKMEPNFPPQLKARWLQALRGPEADLKRQAADTITRAHARGMKDLGGLADELVKLLADEQESTVRLAATRALVALDAKHAADLLWKQAQRPNRDFSRLIELKLAEWQYKPARKVWRQRVEGSERSAGRVKAALHGLAALADREALPAIVRRAVDRGERADVRLAAAYATATLKPENPVAIAEPLVGSPGRVGMVDRLVAVTVLQSATGDRATDVLANMATDEEPAIAARALERLLTIAPQRIVQMADQTMQRTDGKVRRLVAQALVDQASPGTVAVLGKLLADVNPNVRRYVQEAMIDLAKRADLDEAVRTAGMEQLMGDVWQGQSEAILLLTSLGHKPAAMRIADLLTAKRAEVNIGAAWALGRLGVKETLPALQRRAEERTALLFSLPESMIDLPISVKEWEDTNHQLGQLFQSFAMFKHRAAGPMMKRFFAKDGRLIVTSRAPACWALGHVYEAEPSAEIATLLEGRLKDEGLSNQEMSEVRRMSAIALGQMKVENKLRTLRHYRDSEGTDSEVGRACAWAIERMTGEPIPPINTYRPTQVNFFLEPLYRGEKPDLPPIPATTPANPK